MLATVQVTHPIEYSSGTQSGRAAQRSVGLLPVPPAGRADGGAVREGELVQMVAVPPRECIIDGFSELLVRRRVGGDQDAARHWPQIPGVRAVDQLHRDRQMSTAHQYLRQLTVGQGSRAAPAFD